MKNFTKIFLISLLIYSNLLFAKNYVLPESGIAIKNITCLEPSNPTNNQDTYKIISMLIYNKNKYPISNKTLIFKLKDKAGDTLLTHNFELKMSPETAAKEVLAVPYCNDSFFGHKTIYEFSLK